MSDWTEHRDIVIDAILSEEKLIATWVDGGGLKLGSEELNAEFTPEEAKVLAKYVEQETADMDESADVHQWLTAVNRLIGRS